MEKSLKEDEGRIYQEFGLNVWMFQHKFVMIMIASCFQNVSPLKAKKELNPTKPLEKHPNSTAFLRTWVLATYISLSLARKSVKSSSCCFNQAWAPRKDDWLGGGKSLGLKANIWCWKVLRCWSILVRLAIGVIPRPFSKVKGITNQPKVCKTRVSLGWGCCSQGTKSWSQISSCPSRQEQPFPGCLVHRHERLRLRRHHLLQKSLSECEFFFKALLLRF